ncbi:MAG: UbiA prenyltransferase family protein [Fibromonadaceae bacterium]|jgi:4-hydroxybenzoate polyprenyltransferase|nr:UbiA prenyltransferase family protein [Fibromonadaceae bacterium]
MIKLLRLEQWTKNLFIFLPAFFNGQLLNVSVLLPCIVAFIAFSFAASSIYCFNDIYDVEADKQHPEKCKRPIASDIISKKMAYVIMAACFLMSISTLFFFGGKESYTLIALVLFYYAMNMAYCIKLKQYAIIDVAIIAFGFVLRVWVGGTAADIWLSEWIIMMTFLLALFLAFAKRRDDVILHQSIGVSHRKNTTRYNLEFMNQVMTVIATVTMVAYIMFTLSPDVMERFHSKNLYFTAIFVLMGIIRYLQVTMVDLKSGNPTKILLRDRFIQCCIVGWVGLFMVIIYL